MSSSRGMFYLQVEAEAYASLVRSWRPMVNSPCINDTPMLLK